MKSSFQVTFEYQSQEKFDPLINKNQQLQIKASHQSAITAQINKELAFLTLSYNQIGNVGYDKHSSGMNLISHFFEIRSTSEIESKKLDDLLQRINEERRSNAIYLRRRSCSCFFLTLSCLPILCANPLEKCMLCFLIKLQNGSDFFCDQLAQQKQFERDLLMIYQKYRKLLAKNEQESSDMNLE